MHNVLPTKHSGKILTVDDEPTSQAILRAVLEQEGYSVLAATSGEQALQLLDEQTPDLILLDVVMEGIDGFEVCRRLKAHEASRHIPVIFISCTTEASERVKGFQLGAVDFVTKPFQRQELLARVDAHLTLNRMQAALKRQAEELREANMLLQTEIAVRETIASSLAESEEKFRTLAASAQDAFLMLDDQGCITFWNRAATGIFGYGEEEIIGRKFCATLVPERLRTQPALSCLAATPSKPNGGVIELTAQEKSGREFPAEMSVAAVKFREKWVTIVVARDVTERFKAQETLRRSEENLNLALDATHAGTWDLDLKTGSVWRSRHHDQIFGYDRPLERWTSEDFIKSLVPEDRKRYAQEMADLAGKGKIDSEMRIVRADDKAERWLRLQGQVGYDPKGVPERIMGIVIDITDQKLAELERHAAEVQNSLSQKLESVGRLASGVAHEINTPMQFVTDNTQFLKGAVASLTDVLLAYRAALDKMEAGKCTPEDIAVVRAAEKTGDLEYLFEEIPRTFSETMSGLQRVTRIVKSLKEFSHPNKTTKYPADLNKAIDTTITISRHEWKYVADLVAELDPDLPMIPLVIDEMNQVVLNLIVNAAHAIGDTLKQGGEAKGLIKVRTKQGRGGVLIEVEDNGTGIPESAQPHIFEPFFTTKGVGKGTGQGLAIVRTIVVKNHGGKIYFTTQPGKGTTFHLWLPLADPDAPSRG